MIVNKRSLYVFRFLFDLLFLNIAYIIAAVVAQNWETLIAKDHMFIILAFVNFLWYLSSTITSFYDEFSSRIALLQLPPIIKNVLFQAIGVIILIFVFKEDLFTRNFIIYYSLLLTLFIFLRTLVMRQILRVLRKHGKSTRNLLIIGAGKSGKNFSKIIANNPDIGYKLIGFLDEEYKLGNHEEIIGRVDKLAEVIAYNNVDEVVIAMSEGHNINLDKIIRICNIHAVKVHIIPDVFRYLSKRFRVSTIGDLPVITSRSEPLDEVQWRMVKRIFDIVFSLVILFTIMWWLFPILILMIKIDSKGPAFFIQDRIGVKGKTFRCFKFRSMKTGDSLNNRNFKATIAGDPRITRLGKLLRKSNLDELPQFINVLLGDMSVVGPRPHAIPFDSKYGEIVEEIKMRNTVKPGITGWAQIHGLRGDVEDEELNRIRTIKRIEYDLWYIENWSLALDIQIILLTVWQMLRGKSAGK